MKTLLFLLALTASVFAQDPTPIDAQIKAQLGELVFQNAVLLGQMKMIQQENQRLKAENEELKKQLEPTKDK